MAVGGGLREIGDLKADRVKFGSPKVSRPSPPFPGGLFHALPGEISQEA
jgi:hypothetical protein